MPRRRSGCDLVRLQQGGESKEVVRSIAGRLAGMSSLCVALSYRTSLALGWVQIQAMFEKYGFAGAFIQIQAVLTLYAQGEPRAHPMGLPCKRACSRNLCSGLKMHFVNVSLSSTGWQNQFSFTCRTRLVCAPRSDFVHG